MQPSSIKSSSYKVSQFIPSDDFEAWDEFVYSSVNASIFHTSWWYKAWGYEPRLLVSHGFNGIINAGLCYSVGYRFGTKGIVRPPITPQNGPIFVPNDEKSRYANNSFNKKMMHSALCALPNLGLYDFLLRPCDVDVMPFLWNGFDTLIGYSYVIPKKETGCWVENLTKVVRQDIRRALRQVSSNELILQTNPPMEDILTLVRDTEEIKAFSVEKRKGQIERWWNSVLKKNAGMSFLIRDLNNQPMAADMLVFDTHTAYSVLGGIRKDLRRGSLVSLILLDRMIMEAHQRGLNFDFEGSTLPGVEKFMRKFNGELRTIYRVMKFINPIAYAAWHSYRYWNGHRIKQWVRND